MCGCDLASGYKCYAHRPYNYTGPENMPAVAQVNPELERLLAEEEEIEKRTRIEAVPTRTKSPLVLKEMDFLRLAANCQDKEVRDRLYDFYNTNREELVCGSVVIRVD